MAPSQLGRSYGWRPDLPDQRDRVYQLHRAAATGPLPEVVDLRPHMPRVVDQGRLGSCTAQAADGAVGYLLNRAGRTWWRTARLATYYWTRDAEGNAGADTGATIRGTARTLVQRGAAHERLWPYITSTFRRRPGRRVEDDAALRQVTQYLAVPQDPDSMRQVLADGFPIMIGFMCYESLETPDVARTGRVPMPRRNERSLGGHAVLVVGYHATFDHWVVRNSWGPLWGDRGYCYMPTAYLTDPDLAGDAWALEGLEG